MMPLKHAIILLAGTGSRLKPLTDSIHKSLILIGNKTILERQIELLAKYGVRNLHFILGYRAKDITQYLQTLNHLNLNFFEYHNPYYDQTNTAYSLMRVLTYLSRKFLLLDGDVLLEEKLMCLMCQNSNENLLLCDTDVSTLNEEAVKFETNVHNHIIKIGKNIPLSQAKGESIGVGLYQREWSDVLKDYLTAIMKNKKNWQWYYEDAIQNLIQSGRAPSVLKAVPTADSKWIEIDDHEDLKRARDMFT